MKSTYEKEKEGCRKRKSVEGRMETDMALSEFPAFTDNNANQPYNHVHMCYVKKLVAWTKRTRHLTTEKNKRIRLELLSEKKREEKQNEEGENEERSAYASSTSGRNATGKQSDIVCR
ncbi:PREDICTED: uncharacterized protein LOC108759391 [Trachymyrmex cornetzi]|uniref:uncharacterized protein LOC108759391 n=1 Tax=Trachymyrmex cornetzi TaxID=471704 RepID=UPI00084F7AE5|nr:PREDICTED: uncharacterized protein LOC108759391 [Trachymyrmex cornetzi]